MIVTGSKAQSFIDTTKIWTVAERIHTGTVYATDKTIIYKFAGDSILDGLLYTKMITQKEQNDWEFHSLWRENKEGNIYFKNGLSKESVLYNFSLTEGDTFQLGDEEIVIDSIRLKSFGYTNRKFLFSHYSIAPNVIITWVEKVGSLHAPHISDEYFLSGGSYILICFSEGDEHIYMNPNYTDCDASTGTGVNTIFLPENLIECFFEPGGSIKIRNFTNSIGTFYLYDLKGSLLSKTQINSVDTNICPPGTGILLYEFKTKKGKIQTGKIGVTD